MDKTIQELIQERHVPEILFSEQYEMPLPEHPLHQGHIAYHMKTGAHNLDEYDWHNFMDYADGFMKA